MCTNRQKLQPVFIAAIALTLVLSGCNTPRESSSTELSDQDSAKSEAVEVAKRLLTDEHLITEIPEGWIKIRDSRVANLHVAEYVPPDTQETWTEKVSVEAMQGDDLPDPIDFVDGVAHEQAELCNGFANNPIFAGYENGYPTVVKILECLENTRTNRAIVTMLKAIKGNDSLYTISRIWRLPSSATEDGELDIDQDAIAKWSTVLRKSYACHPGNPEHPCKTGD